MSLFKCGLCSVSFRKSSPEEIIRSAKEAGLGYIEWGSDVHAPCRDIPRLESIAKLQQEYNVSCSSYGTYFRIGLSPSSELFDFIRGAKILGTDLLRLWCGVKGSAQYDEREREELFALCREAVEIADGEGVTLAMECHAGTYTDTAQSIVELMTRVPRLRMYWQPDQYRSHEENLLHVRKTGEYVTSVHVFNWEGDKRYPLSDAVSDWREYLSFLEGEHTLLLEFLPDDRIEDLHREAEALRNIIAQ